ncbi:MAG: lipid-A-disaccharide synthase [Myxococcota bacterium]
MGALLVVAGEASADLHASHVVRALKRERPDLRVAGIGSDLCRAEGMEILTDSRELSLMGFTEVLGALGRVRAAFKKCLAFVDEAKPTAALLLDFADFNLRMARELKRRGVKVIYFISPKLWAWRTGRVKLIRERVDRMLVIFPFEVDFYRSHGVTVEYVGNPSLDQLWQPPTREPSRQMLQLPSDAPVIALLPGSRRSEIQRHMAPILDAAVMLKQERPGVRFLLPRATTVSPELLSSSLEAARARDIQVQVVEGHAPEVVAAADAAVVASGTATLEAALVGTPMVVIYRASWLSALIARTMLKIAHVSLVNILARREVVKELLQERATASEIAREVGRLLTAPASAAMRAELQSLRQSLGQPGAPERVAKVVLEVLDTGVPSPVLDVGRQPSGSAV